MSTVNNDMCHRGSIGIFMLIFLPMIVCVLSSFMGIHLLANLSTFLVALIFVFPLISSKKTYKLGREIFVLVVYLLLLVFAYTYSIAKQASYEKVMLVLYNNIVPTLILIFILRNTINPQKTLLRFVRLAMKYSEIILLFLCLLYFCGFRDTAIDGRTYVQGLPGPIWASRYTCMLLIFMLYGKYRKQTKWSILSLVILVLSLYMIYLGDSRGPLLSTAICLFVMLSKSLSLRGKILIIVITIILGFIYITFSPRVSSGGADYSTLARLALIQAFLDSNFDWIKGEGLGSWTMLTTGEDILGYPHNIFIETVTEIGVIGLILLCYVLYKYLKKRNNFILFYVCLFFLINAQVSGDITSNSNLFFFLIMSIVYYDCKEKSNLSYRGAARTCCQ